MNINFKLELIGCLTDSQCFAEIGGGINSKVMGEVGPHFLNDNIPWP